MSDRTIEFVARLRAERRAAGLPESIVDADTLRVVAALVARKRIGGSNV